MNTLLTLKERCISVRRRMLQDLIPRYWQWFSCGKAMPDRLLNLAHMI